MLQNMPHTGAIRNEVARLELIAHDIEKKAAKLVDEIGIGREQRTYNLDDSTYYVYVFTPNSSQQAQVRKLAAKYEAWYNLANELIHAHLPNRAADFEQCYKNREHGMDEGLFYDIQLDQEYRNPGNKYAAIKAIKRQLACQRDLVKSIPDVIDIRSLDVLTVISNDLVNSELSCAEHVFKKDKTHDYCLRVAGILAGIALERHLKTRCESEIGSLPSDLTLYPLIDALYKAQKITLNQKKYLEAIATTRNDCAHATTQVNRTMVSEAISNVRKHLEGNL